jgi:thiol-disulfide isomerase/thioredoxin
MTRSVSRRTPIRDDARPRVLVAVCGAVIAAVVVAGCTATDADDARTSPSGTPTSATQGAPVEVPGVPPCPTSSASVAVVDDGLPDLTLPCLTAGPDVRLAGLRGTPTVINVWASWCPPCRDELPYFVGLQDRFDGRIDVLGIDLLDRDDAARAILEDFALDYPSIVDADGATRAALGIQAPPVTFFVDARGRIVDRKVGAMASQAELDDLVAAAFDLDAR